ncbi:MAG: prepilin-type N-terminal cleavage/methylation domain-containing protein [Gemmatimonadales bacterium]|nr:prepilin-type N-terminal cleavage/methylation domain-containing protein [Gemmatimonadales bacterium]
MDRRGFTLIELLIVVVIIAILAAIAIPKFATTKEASYLAVMRNDLRNLTSAQEAYYNDHQGVYYNGPIPAPELVYNPSKGVSITLQGVSPTGWGATASYANSPRICGVFRGAAGPAGPATVDGIVACSP